MRFPFCNAVLKLIRSVRGNASHFFQTNSAFFRRYLTRAKPDLSFVAEKKIEMSFSESVGDRGSEKIRSDKFFTFFLEPLFLFPSSTPPIGLEPKASGDISRKAEQR